MPYELGIFTDFVAAYPKTSMKLLSVFYFLYQKTTAKNTNFVKLK